MIVDAEKAVLGSCLVGDPRVLVKALGIVRPEHFETPAHQALFKAIEGMHREGKPVDIVTVNEALPSETKPYVVDLVDAVPSALNVEHYAEVVRKNCLQRRFRAAASRAVADPMDEALMGAMLKAANEMQSARQGVVSIGQVVEGYVSSVLDDRATRRVRAFRTGFPSVDRLGQMAPGQFAVVGARTSHGKTAMMLRWAIQMAKAGAKVLFESCEMTDVELLDRIVAAEINVNSLILRDSRVRGVMARVTEVCDPISRWPFYLRQGGKINRATIESDIETIQPDVVFLDYLQIVDIPERIENRAAYFSDLANGLKRLATQKKVLIVAGSQFSRDIDKRGASSRPTMADFKESGGIEQAVDMAFGIHIELDRTKEINTGDLLLMKNRNGPCLEIPVRLVMGTTRFDEVTQDAPMF